MTVDGARFNRFIVFIEVDLNKILKNPYFFVNELKLQEGINL